VGRKGEKSSIRDVADLDKQTDLLRSRAGARKLQIVKPQWAQDYAIDLALLYDSKDAPIADLDIVLEVVAQLPGKTE
jgi:hypothetical protein